MAIDLDKSRAARRESKNEPPVLITGGKEYHLPIEMPFEALEALRGMDDPETAPGALVDFVKVILGDDYEEIKPTLAFDDMEELVVGLMDEYGVKSPLASST